RIKGGRLAAHAHPARVVTLAISDVPGDDPAVIGSGPTLPDPTTLREARAVLQRRHLALPPPPLRALGAPADQRPHPRDRLRAGPESPRVARPAEGFPAVGAKGAAGGCEPVFLGDRVEGEAREVAAAHGRLARELQAAGRRAVILSGGELTVTLRGQGRGGPNQEYALALAIELAGAPG